MCVGRPVATPHSAPLHSAPLLLCRAGARWERGGSALCSPLATLSFSWTSSCSAPGRVRTATPATDPSCAGSTPRRSSTTSAWGQKARSAVGTEPGRERAAGGRAGGAGCRVQGADLGGERLRTRHVGVVVAVGRDAVDHRVVEDDAPELRRGQGRSGELVGARPSRCGNLTGARLQPRHEPRRRRALRKVARTHVLPDRIAVEGYVVRVQHAQRRLGAQPRHEAAVQELGEV